MSPVYRWLNDILHKICCHLPGRVLLAGEYHFTQRHAARCGSVCGCVHVSRKRYNAREGSPAVPRTADFLDTGPVADEDQFCFLASFVFFRVSLLVTRLSPYGRDASSHQIRCKCTHPTGAIDVFRNSVKRKPPCWIFENSIC